MLVAVTAFVLGLVAAGTGDGADTPAERFAAAWQAGEVEAMHDELTPAAQAEFPLRRFRAAYRSAARTATVEAVEAQRAGEAEADGATVEIVQARLRTHAFGELGGELRLPVSADGIAWAPHLAFPGLEEGEELMRRTRAPMRAPIVATDGTVLAEGPATARTLPIGPAAAAVVGELGTPPPAVARQREQLGFPPSSPAGTSGLELAYDERLAGTPGGELLAASTGGDGAPEDRRVLAASEPREGAQLRTTIDAELQTATVEALGGLFGGIAVLDAKRGDVRALAGAAFTAPQPPGSTFKVITAVAALDEGVVDPADEFPVETVNHEIGREIRNSGEQPCGGTFAESFAQSCNTVFAPLGAELGAETLVEAAEAFGFNSPPTLHGTEATAAIDPPTSTIPTDLSGTVDVGVSAIGQGEVLATPLQMASVAQAVANRGVRRPTPIVKGGLAPEAAPERVTSRGTADTVRELMVEVVESGTGTAAALPEARVAGKTGTAELGPRALEAGEELAPGETPEQELDAWFLAFAPAGNPEVAVAVMIVDADGDGGSVAAPIARTVLEAALG